MTRTFLLLGAGYSARAFAPLARNEGHRVIGTTRDDRGFDTLAACGIEPLLFDGEHAGDELLDAVAGATDIVVSAGPGRHGDPVLGVLGAAISAAPALGWIAYLSTIGVYGDTQGGWVDEDSPCPAEGRGKARLDAEAGWRRVASDAGVPLAILRLSGIYGPGRNAFVQLEGGTARRIVKPGQVFNRIHVDDIAGALAHLARTRAGGIVNVTDDEPAPPQDVVACAAQLMGVAPPPETPYDPSGMSPMGRSFWEECKRASNARLKQSGYRLIHPTYRAALDAMWRDGTWRAPLAQR